MDRGGYRAGMRAAIAVAALAAGCGRWGFEPTAAMDDAAVDAADGIDAADPIDGAAGVDALQPVCTSGTFGTPELVTGLGLSGDLYGTSPLAGGDGIVFSHVPTGPNSEDIYLAARISGSQMQAAEPVAGVNTSAQDGTPFVTLDGLELFFSSEQAGTSGRDLFIATRASISDGFVIDRRLGELASSGLDHTPSMTGDGRTLYFGTDRDDPGRNENIYRATRAGPFATFDAPVAVAELSGSSYDTSPFVRADGLVIYFMSSRSGGAGCDDIWVATRDSTADPFGTPAPLTEVNSSACEDDPALSADGCELWFSSDRGGSGYQIYRAAR